MPCPGTLAEGADAMRNTAVSNTIYASVGSYAEYALGLVASILTARALQPADMGVYSLLVWIVATSVVVANAGITLAAIKFIAELRGAEDPRMVAVLVRRLRRMQRIMLAIVAAVVVLVFVFARGRLAPGVDPWLLGLLVLSVGFRAPYMFNVAILKGYQDFRSVAAVTTIGAVLNLAMIFAAWTQSAALPAFVVAYATSSLVFHAISQWRASRWVEPAPAGAVLPPALEERLRRHLRVVAFTAVLGTVGSSEIELLSLNLYAAATDAAMFKVANALASGLALLVPGVLAAQLLPLMAHAQGRGKGEAEHRFVVSTAWLFILGAPLVSFGVLLGGQVVELLYGNAYALAAPVLAALLVARVASVLGQGATAYLLSADRQTALMRLTLLFTVLRFGGAFAGAYLFGLWGAVAATVVLALLGSGVTIRLARKVADTRLPWARMVRIAVAALLPALCCLPLLRWTSPLAGLLIGAVVFAIGYPLALWLLRALSEEDQGYVRALAGRLVALRSRS
jgi:O-antigen/teichoic acid export membrane protein